MKAEGDKRRRQSVEKSEALKKALEEKKRMEEEAKKLAEQKAKAYKERAERLRELEKEMQKKSRDRKSGSAGGISPWVEEELEPTAPVSDSRLRFDYTASISGSAAAGGCAAVPVASDSDSDDVMMDFMPKKRKLSYAPSNKVITHINNTLECYSKDADSPNWS